MRAVRIAAVVLAAVLGLISARTLARGAEPMLESTTTTTTTTPQATVPGAPTLVSATAGPDGISLRWTAPSSDGGAAISGYRVYRATGSGTLTALATLGVVDSYTTPTRTARPPRARPTPTR
jgi:hypothetical protein